MLLVGRAHDTSVTRNGLYPLPKQASSKACAGPAMVMVPRIPLTERNYKSNISSPELLHFPDAPLRVQRSARIC